MTHPSARSSFTFVVLAGPWIVAAVAASHLAAHPFTVTQQQAASTVVGAMFALISAGMVLLSRPDTTGAGRRAVGYAAGLAAPFLAVLATQLSGANSMAFVAACLCALGAIVATGWQGVCIGSAGISIVTFASPALAGQPTLPFDHVAHAVAVLFSVTVLPMVYLTRASRRSPLGTRARRPSPSDEANEPLLDISGLAGHCEIGVDSAAQISGKQSEALTRYLRQIRDTLGVSEVVYWDTARAAGTLLPLAWAGDDSVRWTTAHHAIGSAFAAVKSASQVTRVTLAGEGAMAAIAVAGPAGSGGVLSVHARKLSVPDDVLERWMPRVSDHLGMLVHLLESQSEYSRQHRQGQSLLQASQGFQQLRTVDEMGQSICDSALTMTRARRAALVRWYGETSTGVIQSVTSGHHLSRGAPVAADSLVGQLCIAGLPQVWEDAQQLENATPIYNLSHVDTKPGSLTIVPFRQGGAISGAIVLEGEHTADGLLLRDLRSVRLLAAIAALSLESVWQIEEATRRSRTDALTGLASRRTFDEALTRAIAEADRFGHHVGLVVCDVDNFKRVNDLYGREVGDHVLRSIAASLSTGVRGVDLVARYGGEEMIMLLGKADVAMAWEVAERMRSTIEAMTIGVGEHIVHVTASFGVASYPETARLGDELFPAADKALYAAKREGRNCVRFARPLSSEQADEGEGIPEDGEGEF